ncbi:IPT/TIG domain-containing protein [Microbispora sp. NPDC049125]|uniref:IPT/TIG domain-containing protein n=1 Tax=Microbispora sp. NPDC049125 TaxID=3154929 RepID=UPI003466D49D
MAPVITSLSAAPQNTNQGSYAQILTINGTGLLNTTSARIGGKTVAATNNLAGTVVTCTLPSGCGPTTVAVVTTTGTSNALPFYYIDPPFASRLSPVENSAETPLPVTITGETLLTTNRVQFAGVTATLTPPTSDVTVSATPQPVTPLGAAPWFQSQSAAVRTAGGTFTVANALAFFDTPAITALDPATGAGGDLVIITGTAFVGAAITVTFAGVDTDITVNSDTQILAFAPTGPAGAVDVVVTTPGGASDPATFTYA